MKEEKPSEMLRNMIRKMMNKGVISEEDLLSFMRKKEKIKMKKESSLRWKNIPTTPKT